ncbi:MAG TPA: hypothetical protein VK826_20600 [Bacteroidia bacterium]|nr:hypothetical protein [Bacteroidia bacterium]
MIIWRGPMGLMVLLVFGAMIFLTGFMFEENTKNDLLRMSSTSFFSAVAWFGMLKLFEKNTARTEEMERQLERPELLDEKTRKRAEAMVKMKAHMDMNNSSFFFIPIKWWHFIFLGLGILFLVLHFTN